MPFVPLCCKSEANNYTSSNQRLGECVRPKMESQVVAKKQGCWQTMQFNMPQMER